MKRTVRQRTTVVVAALVTVAVVLFLCIFYHDHDPATGGAPKCMFRLITGYDCPGCGSQRAFHAILNGDIAAAWSLNPYIFFAVPAAAFFIVAESGKRHWPRFHAAVTRPSVIAVILAATLAWWIGRNL